MWVLYFHTLQKAKSKKKKIQSKTKQNADGKLITARYALRRVPQKKKIGASSSPSQKTCNIEKVILLTSWNWKDKIREKISNNLIFFFQASEHAGILNPQIWLANHAHVTAPAYDVAHGPDFFPRCLNIAPRS